MVNLSFMLTNSTISDIVKDFLALVIISDFDDYFFLTVRKTLIGKLISDGECDFGGSTLSLAELTKIETTTSRGTPESSMIAKIFED